MKFDYIIIGAGSAGCVLANRLSADPSNQVLLIESGGKDTKLEIHVPAAYSKLNRTEVDWGFSTEPQKHVLNRRIYLPRGKTLGGSSSVNAMAYVRGNAEDYNDWAALGNKGWAYSDVLPYFKKSEHNEQISDQYHGQGGELNVTYPKKFRTPFAEAFVEACIETGFSDNKDLNGASQEGAGLIQFTIKDQKRHSGATAFLKPVMSRANLKVMIKTQVKRIIVENDKAVGVEVISGKNNTEQIRASKEVILSAGAFCSPQTLLLSGIGDASELAFQDIKLVKELPGVGKNLQDHLFTGVSALSTTQRGQNHNLSAINQVKGLIQYFLTKSGPFTISPLEALAFGAIDPSKDTRVDYQLHFVPIQIGDDYKVDMYNTDTFPLIDGYTVLPTLLRPESRGFVGISSGNPFDAPVIQPNFLESENDQQLLLKATKKAMEVMQTKAFGPHSKKIITPPDLSSDDAIMHHIKMQLETVYHPVGTCKMGHDEMAVVNDRLQVHGIEGLRVVDASIMPNIVSGNTNAPVYMIAEKASDMILGV
jgi:choline dehydrogenase